MFGYYQKDPRTRVDNSSPDRKDGRSRSPKKTQKVSNKRSDQRRFTHKVTLGDSNSEVFTCRYNPDDKYMACGFGDGAIRIYNTQSTKCAYTLCSAVDAYGKSDDMPVTALRWRPPTENLKTNNVLVAAYADGYLKHWHATSGRCLHAKRADDDDQQEIYSIDYNAEGLLLATTGKDKYVRLYDEQTKSVVLKMKGLGENSGHSNRVFCVRFNHHNGNVLASGGWDNTVQIYDIRKKGPAISIYGPHICGDAIDFYKDSYTLLTGSYRQDNVLELWDIRKKDQRLRIIDWNGPKASETLYQQMETKPLNKEDAVEVEEEEHKEREKVVDDERKVIGEEPTETEGYSRQNPAPMLYSAMFNHKQDMIMAAGAGANQVRLFDYNTGAVLCMISDMPRPILCMAKANTSTDFAFGSVDSKLRIMQMRQAASE